MVEVTARRFDDEAASRVAFTAAFDASRGTDSSYVRGQLGNDWVVWAIGAVAGRYLIGGVPWPVSEGVRNVLLAKRGMAVLTGNTEKIMHHDVPQEIHVPKHWPET